MAIQPAQQPRMLNLIPASSGSVSIPDLRSSSTIIPRASQAVNGGMPRSDIQPHWRELKMTTNLPKFGFVVVSLLQASVMIAQAPAAKIVTVSFTDAVMQTNEA